MLLLGTLFSAKAMKRGRSSQYDLAITNFNDITEEEYQRHCDLLNAGFRKAEMYSLQERIEESPSKKQRRVQPSRPLQELNQVSHTQNDSFCELLEQSKNKQPIPLDPTKIIRYPDPTPKRSSNPISLPQWQPKPSFKETEKPKRQSKQEKILEDLYKKHSMVKSERLIEICEEMHRSWRNAKLRTSFIETEKLLAKA